MLATKERLFRWYYEISEEAIEAIQELDLEILEECLTKREQLIMQINEIDRDAGEILLNESIRDLIIKIKEVDGQLIIKMNEMKVESAQKLREIQAGKQLQNKYQEEYNTIDSVFYDKRK